MSETRPKSEIVFFQTFFAHSQWSWNSRWVSTFAFVFMWEASLTSKNYDFWTFLCTFALKLQLMLSQHLCICDIFRVLPQIAKAHIFPAFFFANPQADFESFHESILESSWGRSSMLMKFWFWLEPEAQLALLTPLPGGWVTARLGGHEATWSSCWSSRCS